MKTLRFLFLTSILLIGICSCYSNIEQEGMSIDDAGITQYVELSEAEFISVMYDNKRELKENEVFDIVKRFQSAYENKTPTRGLADGSTFKIKGKYYISTLSTIPNSRSAGGEKIESPIYEVALNNGESEGLAIVSGDSRAPIVLAYIPKVSNQEEFNLSAASELMRMSKESLLLDLMKMKSIRDSLKTITIEKISSSLGIKPTEVTLNVILQNVMLKSDGPNLTRATSTQIENMPTQILSMVYPMITTNWDQRAPYNSKLMMANVWNGSGGTYTNVYAGCAVIAVAQLLAYCEPSMTIGNAPVNWSLLKENSKISNTDSQQKKEMIGSLIAEIYEKTATQPSYNDSGYVTGSGSYYYNYIPYMNQFVLSGDYQLYNADVVKNSLDRKRPLLIRGEGHAFILDGYIIAKKNTRTIVKNYDLYWHANLGWGDLNTGFYRLNLDTNVDFESGSNVYHTENLYIVPDIVKK